MRGKKITRICKYCDEPFEALAIKVRIGKALFCSKEHYHAYRSKHKQDPKERAIIYQKKHKYGLSEKQYKDMFDKQDNKCAICGGLLDKKPCVDHCHTTDKVRGLLCDKCNRGLGYFRDDTEILSNAIAYLNKTGR